jgi:hypothetical protein
MARAFSENIISHWHNPVGNLDASPLEFYAAVDWAIKERQIPDATTERIAFRRSAKAWRKLH